MLLETPTAYLSAHAARQAVKKGISIQAAERAANDPQHSYPSLRFPGQTRCVRDGIVAVLDESRTRIITLYADQEHTPLRDDQTDADALAYATSRS